MIQVEFEFRAIVNLQFLLSLTKNEHYVLIILMVSLSMIKVHKFFLELIFKNKAKFLIIKNGKNK